jgi:predicted DNA-binding antitoxin AbrB/MazE fold protein
MGMKIDNDEFAPGYKQKKMFIQFSKIEDSQENLKPLDTVKTDDGEIVKVTCEQATKLKALERSFQKPVDKLKFADTIQQSKGLNQWLNSPILAMFEVDRDDDLIGNNSIYS